ncbi:hypothetical protein BKA81DRAFT_366835 [Phyllosticta paracitricarpa]|uniref:Transcription factor TFIIIC triple barrel domain-containing protein n=2 Tax=Phyllosticta TaxID=121621 RepID=A0ABR1MID0_9PEZI
MAAAPASANRGADSDDWEYEYDDTDTQDVYFTLDLTSHTAVSAPKKGFNKLEHDIFAEEARGKKKNGVQDHEAADDANGTPQEHANDDIEAEEDEDEEEDRLQIVGLHHDNPIVSYKGQAYTCKWASTIGTDLFFARAPDADADADDDQPPVSAPLRPLGTFNMLGASSTRLVATAAKLRERTSTEQRGSGTLAGASSSSAVASSSQAPAGNPSSVLFTRTDNVPHFYVPPNATRAQKRQASFLENFAAVKARLGEKDNVRATSYMLRSGPRPAAAAAAESSFYTAQSDGDADDGAGPSTPRLRAARQSASFVSAQLAASTNDAPSANGNGSPAGSASPSAEPAPSRGRGSGRVGRPRGRGRGRPRGRGRGRGRGRKTAVDEDADAGDEAESIPTPALWDGDVMAGVESSASAVRRGSVGEVLAQQQSRIQEEEAGSDDMQE